MLALGCARSDATSRYDLLLRTSGDPGRPLAGARVSFRGHNVGKTGDAGTLGVAIEGGEGEHVALSVVCPDGFASPSAPVDVVLHRLVEPGRKPEYDVSCPPVRRNIVVVVRADHGAGLPVMYLAREIARTDESGAAHAVVSAPSNEDVEIVLSTKEPEHERLRPQNPSMKFASSDTNEIKMFNVQFQLEPLRHPSAPHSTLPVRLH
jgi:hypothetical protein